MNIKQKNNLNIIEVFKQNKAGFSISFKEMALKKYKKGYAVSITNFKTNNINIIEDLFNKVLKVLNTLNINEDLKIIGGWVYEGFYYLDASILIKDIKTAEIVGKLFNQISIYNFYKKNSIKII